MIRSQPPPGQDALRRTCREPRRARVLRYGHWEPHRAGRSIGLAEGVGGRRGSWRRDDRTRSAADTAQRHHISGGILSTTTAVELRDAGKKRSAADHAGTIRAFYPFWDVQYRPFLILAVEALPTDRFDFKPRPEMMTARQVVLHIAEAERWWIEHIVEGQAYEDYVVSQADPAQGFATAHEAPDHASLLTVLAKCHRATQRWLERPATELGRVIQFQPEKGPERRYTLHWILDHLQEHEIHHRAQLNLYLRLMEITPPSI